jgi:hypothetical protein
MFWDYLKALRRETLPAVIAAFSFASTALTFVPQLGVSGRIRLIPIGCLVVGFVWAHTRVFAKQRSRILELEASLANPPARRAKLVIHEGRKASCVPIRKSEQNMEPVATYFEFHMAVENKGDRHSNINRYDLDIPQMGKFENLIPVENRIMLIQAVGFNYSPAQPYLMMNGFIAVEAEKMTTLAYLPFQVPAPPPASGPLHCVLTLTDTEGNSASHKFVLREG